jgi:anti-sigma regulatory factor (Ser/Thr protein kinase)
MPLACVSAATITIRNDPDEIARAAALADRFAGDNRLPAEAVADLQVALDEVLTNIIKYGYTDGRGHDIHVALRAEGDMLVVEIEDDGIPFDPLALPSPDTHAPLGERRVGGIGIHFVRELMSEVRYERVAGRNRLSFKRRIGRTADGVA